jgi:aminoglycoside/choline kinase family phosphotransferase
MRILGIIVRRAAQTGRNDKFAFLPRIRAYVNHLLQDEALEPVRQWVEVMHVE